MESGEVGEVMRFRTLGLGWAERDWYSREKEAWILVMPYCVPVSDGATIIAEWNMLETWCVY